MPDTEKIGTSTVKLAIAASEYLKEFISEGDKGPSLDGYICGFSKTGYKKKDEKGRAPVQVKGKSTNAHSDLNREKLSYPVEVDDLRCFKREGGAIFFVVLFFAKNIEQKKIFYAQFLPYDINEIIKGKETQKTVTVPFKPFPTGAEMDDVILNFIDDRNKQSSIINTGNITVEQIVKNTGSTAPLTVSLGYTSTQRQMAEKPFQYFFDHDFYVYHKLENSIMVPTQHITRMESIGTEYDVDVSVGDIHYFDRCQLIYHKDTTEYAFYNSGLWDEDEHKEGEPFIKKAGFRFVKEDKTNAEGKSKVTYFFALKGNLQERINLERFILAFIQENGFQFNGKHVDLSAEEQEVQKLNRDSVAENLIYLEEVQQTLDILGCTLRLKLDDLTEDDEKKIRYLVLAILHDQSLRFNEDIPPLAVYEVVNLHLLLGFEILSDGSYKLHPFDWQPLEYSIDSDDGLKPTSFYTGLNTDNYIQISNLNYSKVAESVCSYDNVEHYDRANMTLLCMLSAYDETGREGLLEATSRIARWLTTKPDDDEAIAKINFYQCIKRKAQLSDDDKRHIMALIDENHNRNDILAGCYALLDNKEMAHHYLETMEQEQRESFKKFPIMRFIL